MNSVLIIGGGAAGMAAAIAAASCGDSVLLLERMDRVGKKILATGNGRCNLMNVGERRYPGGAALADAVLDRFGVHQLEEFWRTWGLRLRQEDGGRVYPVSAQASSVLDTLRLTMQELGVESITGVKVESIQRKGSFWQVKAGGNIWRSDRVIMAGGGCAQPKLGSDGSMWQMASALGHTIVPARPALTQVITDTAPIRGLSGIRVRCSVRVMGGGSEKYKEQGELLFADYGVSGVCVMQCARYCTPGDELYIDLTRAMGCSGLEDLLEELRARRDDCRRRNSARPAGELMTGLCVPKLAIALLRNAGVRSMDVPIASLGDKQLVRIAEAAACMKLMITGCKGFDSAQVAAGGVAAEEVCPDTLASVRHEGLHMVGEMLDVDGDCGGYNLMFAFASGILAGLNGREIPWKSCGR